MGGNPIITAALGVALAISPLTEAAAAAYGAQRLGVGQTLQALPIQWAPDHRPGGFGPRGPGPGPHAYPGWRGQPGWRGAPAWRGPPGWAGRPYWFGRPWAPRPYYGTIIAGVALGTLITVAAVGAVPPRPRPDLCWYWADPNGYSGYWDYC